MVGNKTPSPSLLGAFTRGRKQFQPLKWAFSLDWFHLWHRQARQVQSLECSCLLPPPPSLSRNDRRPCNTTQVAPGSLRNKWKQLSQGLSEELSPSRHWNLEPLPSWTQLRWLNLYLTYTSIIWTDTSLFYTTGILFLRCWQSWLKHSSFYEKMRQSHA